MQGFTAQNHVKENFIPDKMIQGITQGQFILDGETIFLQTNLGNRFSLDQVGIAATAFNDLDGVLRYPKPTIYDDAGNVEQQGDLLLIAFENGDIFNPVVLSSIIPAKGNEFFHKYTLDTYQQKKARFETEQCLIEFSDDGKGEISLDVTAIEGEKESGTGNITINLSGVGEDENGNLTINVSGNVNINTKKDTIVNSENDITVKAANNALVEAVNEVTVKGDAKTIVNSPLIELGKDATEKLVLGDKWAALFKMHTHPTGVGPSGPPIEAAQADSCLSEQNTTL